MDHGAMQGPTDYLRRAVDNVPSMLAYWDCEMRCRYANRAYEKWFGVDPERLIGTSLRDLLGPELFALNEPYIAGALRGEEQTFERVVPGADGVERHSLASYLPDRVGGVVAGFIVSVTEVTRLKRTETNLRSVIKSLEDEIHKRRTVEENLLDTQQSLAVTLASIDAGFIATDRLGRVTQMNHVSERLTGWSQAEAQGQLLWEVFVRDDRPAAFTAMNPVDVMLDQGLTVETVHQVTAVSRDGTRTPVEAQAALTHANDGEARGIAIVLRDRSRVLQAEIESNRLAAIVESSYDAIIGKTLDGRITSWNAAAQALFGYSASEAIGQPVQMLIPADRQDEEMRILASLARGVPVPPFDTLRRAKDGSLIDVVITISPIRDAQGRVAGASKIVRDVTQHKLAELARLKAERLEAENRQIEMASRLKSQFLANMSHELRTPLNAIIGFSELMHSGRVRPDSPKHQTYLGHIASSGRHLLQLINDVLDLSKVESGKFEFFPEPVNLPVLVKEVSDILRTGFDRKNIRLTSELDPLLTDIVLDPARLKQVLYNYLSNAVKFTPDGGQVTVRARAHGTTRFRLEVQDSGIGISAQEIPRLFTEFQQLDAGFNRAHQGTGLGLALTRRLVEAQGGSVGVDSIPGRGSVFHVILDRVHGTDAVPLIEGVAAMAPQHRLLVIEDDGPVQARMVQALSDAGFHVEAAASGEQASRLALDLAFDGLTLDLQLPDQPGLGLLHALRRDAPRHSTPVIGLTAPATTGTGASFAIADILCKPLRSAELVASMARFQVPDGGRARVMVIDDEPLSLELMRAALAGIGVDAMCMQDARQALREIGLHRPDAIILDLMMPGFDGFAVLDELHRLPEWRDTPVFIWTSMLLTDEEYASLGRSALAVVNKGGGQLAAMLERLRQWRPVAETLPKGG